MSRKPKRQSRRRRGVEPVDIQVREAGPDALEEFFRFGGPSVFSCGCSAHDAVQISIDDAGSAAYPIGDGLGRSDIEEFREAIGDEPILVVARLPQERERRRPQPHRSRLRPRAC